MQIFELDLVAARKKIVSFISSQVSLAGAKGVVVGVSGGVDSALTTYLSVEALGAERVFGLVLPDSTVTPETDVNDANLVVRLLTVQTRQLDIHPIFEVYKQVLGLPAQKIPDGNLRARIRMSILYYFANARNYLVAGTGDRSEHILNYFTKGGDGMVDFEPIGDLYKTEVRAMADLVGVPKLVWEKPSSPRLWAGHEAEEELGLSYEVIDKLLPSLFDGDMRTRVADAVKVAAEAKVDLSVVNKILNMSADGAHKRSPPPTCKVREPVGGANN